MSSTSLLLLLSPSLSSSESEELGRALAVHPTRVALMEARRGDHQVLKSPLCDTWMSDWLDCVQNPGFCPAGSLAVLYTGSPRARTTRLHAAFALIVCA